MRVQPKSLPLAPAPAGWPSTVQFKRSTVVLKKLQAKLKKAPADQKPTLRRDIKWLINTRKWVQAAPNAEEWAARTKELAQVVNLLRRTHRV